MTVTIHAWAWHVIQLYLTFEILWRLREGIKVGRQIDWRWWAADLASGRWFVELARDLAQGYPE